MQDQLNDAIESSNLTKVMSLLSAGASADDLDSRGWTPLMQATETGNIEIIRLLLMAGGNLNKKGIDGCTCLHIAVDAAIDETIQNGKSQGEEATEVIEFLIENGADILAATDGGETPLDWAYKYKSVKIIRLLKESFRQPS